MSVGIEAGGKSVANNGNIHLRTRRQDANDPVLVDPFLECVVVEPHAAQIRVHKSLCGATIPGECFAVDQRHTGAAVGGRAARGRRKVVQRPRYALLQGLRQEWLQDDRRVHGAAAQGRYHAGIGHFHDPNIGQRHTEAREIVPQNHRNGCRFRRNRHRLAAQRRNLFRLRPGGKILPQHQPCRGKPWTHALLVADNANLHALSDGAEQTRGHGNPRDIQLPCRQRRQQCRCTRHPLHVHGDTGFGEITLVLGQIQAGIGQTADRTETNWRGRVGRRDKRHSQPGTEQRTAAHHNTGKMR